MLPAAVAQAQRLRNDKLQPFIQWGSFFNTYHFVQLKLNDTFMEPIFMYENTIN